MASPKPDAANRRREQNRLAQRRFRWKRSEAKATAKDSRGQSIQEDACFPPSEPPISSDGPSPMAPGGQANESASMPTTAPCPSRLPCVYSILQNYTLLDFGRVDYDPIPPTGSNDPSPLPTCTPGASEDVDGWPSSSESRFAAPGLALETPSELATISATQPVSQNVPAPAGDGKKSGADTRLGAGASGSTVSRGPLHVASQKGNSRIVEALLQHRTNCNEKDSDGMTPLMHAAAGGYEKIVTALLQHGARVDEVDQQRRSAVHWAAAHSQLAVLHILLENLHVKELVDGRDGAGKTALHLAVENEFEAGVCALLEYGANPNLQG